jgi:hypothetical protein
MDRRELFGALGALGAVPVCGAVNSAEAADHGHGGKGGPLSGQHAHFCGIHMAKGDTKRQFITQHYCTGHARGDAGQVFQCVLFDSTKPDAKLVGVEYIISDDEYKKLPEDEKKYWHAHTYEVLGGGLIAPDMDPAEEKKFMKAILTTWGKAWHTWPDLSKNVPIGPPMLIWSLMGDGQVDKNVLAKRDEQFKVDTAKISETRCKELGWELPNVPLPANVDTIGRQWTKDGKDEGTPKKK